MMSRSREAGMCCCFTSLALIAIGYIIWKKQKTDLIPGYKHKYGEDTKTYCTFVGKGIMLAGIGLFILSVPISLEAPDKFFALCCLICCLIFVGTGLGLYMHAEKRYHS